MNAPRATDTSWSETHIPSYLDTIPEDAQCVNYWREDGQMVPIAKDGELWLLTTYRHLDRFLPTPAISAADYVVGLELLGFRFVVSISAEGDRNLFRREPEELPSTWNTHARRIIEAFEGRKGEAADFILQRNAGQGSIYVGAKR